MSYYAGLDVSTIDDLPPGRTPIVTKLVNEARRRDHAIRFNQPPKRGAGLLGLPVDRGE